MNYKKFYFLLFFVSFLCLQGQSILLNGDIVRYPTNKTSSKNAFDNNASTHFEALIPTGSWVGLDLGGQHIITEIEFIAGTKNMQTGYFEASNNSDFSDAFQLYTIGNITTSGTTYKVSAKSFEVGQSYRYIRYFGAENSYCIVNELKFYGTKVYEEPKLEGEIIRYHTNKSSSKNAFDDNPSTYFDAYIATGSWVGLDLGSPHIINRIEFISGGLNMQTGIFEASNDPDFINAVYYLYIPMKVTI